MKEIGKNVRELEKNIKKLKSFLSEPYSFDTHQAVLHLKETIRSDQEQIIQALNQKPKDRSENLQREALLKQMKLHTKEFRELNLKLLNHEAESSENFLASGSNIMSRQEFVSIHDIQRIIDEEKQKELEQLQEDMNLLQNAFNDLGYIQNKQGEQLYDIEIEVDRADRHVEIAGKELEKAKKYHSKYTNKKICFFSVLFIIVALGIGSIIYFTI